MELYNIIGGIGVFLLILDYFLLETGKVKPHDISYCGINIAACVCVLYSLAFAWNLPSFIIQVSFIAISIYGINRGIKDRKKG